MGKKRRVNVDREGSLWGVNSKEGVRGESWELGERGDLERERLSGVRSEWEREGSEWEESGVSVQLVGRQRGVSDEQVGSL